MEQCSARGKKGGIYHFGQPFATATRYIYMDDVAALWAAIIVQPVPVRPSPTLRGTGPEEFGHEGTESSIKWKTDWSECLDYIKAARKALGR